MYSFTKSGRKGIRYRKLFWGLRKGYVVFFFFFFLLRTLNQENGFNGAGEKKMYAHPCVNERVGISKRTIT